MWFLYALLFAVTSSFSVIIAKKVMKTMDHYTFLLAASLFTVPFLLLNAIILFDTPKLDETFWMATVVGTCISGAASIIAYKAIKESEISLVNPISAFNPVFTAIISYFTLNEIIKTKGVFGIIVVVTGAYILNISASRKGIFEPIKSLVNHRGVQLSLLAYFLWSITPTLEKTAILHTFPQNPSFAALMGQFIVILIYTPFVLRRFKTSLEDTLTNLKWFVVVGVLGGVGITAAFLAYVNSPLGIATAVFKTSMIIVPVLGYWFFKDKDIKQRLVGSLVMLLGVVLLVI